METVVSVRELRKSYGGKPAVAGVSFEVARGETFGLLGANGAGKTTTLECLLGVRTPDSGSATILGMDPQAQRRELFERVGVQFQEARYQDKITVDELCRETRALYRDADDPARLLARFGLADARNRAVESLSGGQRQRLFVALALIPRPEVVFLDELTTGLDVKARRGVSCRDEVEGPDHSAHQPFHGRGGGAVRPNRHHAEGPHRVLGHDSRGRSLELGRNVRGCVPRLRRNRGRSRR